MIASLREHRRNNQINALRRSIASRTKFLLSIDYLAYPEVWEQTKGELVIAEAQLLRLLEENVRT